MSVNPGGMCFGCGGAGNAKCEKCGQEIKPGDKLVMDRKTIHKACFKCAICNEALTHGAAGLDTGLSRYGLVWLCRPHLNMDPSEKQRLIVQKGYKEKGKK